MSPTTINIAIVHSEPAERDALCDFIADEVGFRVVGGSGPGPDALELVRSGRVHVVVIDLDSVPYGAGDLIADLRAAAPGSGVLLLVGGDQAGQLPDLMQRGATGYVENARIPTHLTAALRTIGMGHRYVPA